jgi:hypothetical protein
MISKATYQAIKQVFDEIDLAIASSITSEPIPFDSSNFKMLYQKIKDRWTQ